MSDSLLRTRRFAPLFWCQFFSAFNDNFLKNALVTLIVFVLVLEQGEQLVQIATAIFIAPYFFLSGIGGEMADRYDKALMARRLKFAEIFAALVGATGFVLHSVPILMATLGLFGIIAALFGPIKYGILPDHLKTEELPAGNALVESATFIAILLGTIAGIKAARVAEDPLWIAGLLMVFALASWGSARQIPLAGEKAPNLRVNPNIMASTVGLIRDVWHDTRLWRGTLAVSWFWIVGAIVLPLISTLVRNRLGGDENLYIAFMAIFSVSIALGSGLAAWMSHGRIILLPTVIGAVLMGVFAVDLGLATWAARPGPELVGAFAFFATGNGVRIGIDVAGLALAGGLFVVPTFAAVQSWAGEDHRARVIAAGNVIQALLMTCGALAVAALQSAGATEAHIILGLGVLNFAVAAATLTLLPVRVFRDFLSILFRAVYRMEVTGLENFAKGGRNPIIALNHVSFLDAGLALSLTDRDPVFAIDHTTSQYWWVKPFLKLTRAMPLDPTKPMAVRTLIHTVEAGEPLVIFPEGRITVTGSLMKVYDGAGLIADKSGAMVVPVRIDGLEATPFSRLSAKQVRRRWFPKVRVTVLEPVKLGVDPELKGRARRQAAGAALYGVMSDLVFRTTSTDRSVFEAVVEAACIHGPGRVAIDDPVSGPLSYRRLLAGARALGAELSGLAREGETVGVLLPTSNGAAVTLLGLMSAGRVPAMLNFTAGAANLLAACKAAQVTSVVTSRAFVEKGRLEPLAAALGEQVRLVWLEDVRAKIGRGARLRALLAWKRPLARRKADDRAVVLFTSGTEGSPKGVVLSNRNLLANAAQAAARIDFGRTDTVFNVLPVFHSFGLTIGLVLPLVSGVRVYLYPSPLHYRIVPELAYGVNATILFGTDTFLAGYARSAHPYDFRSLRYVLAGAEPVKEPTRRAWMEKFGLRVLEGYGITETAPALALNTPMFNRFGTVGRFLPGMEIRLEPTPGVPDAGRLFVRGPNVMLGYVRAENPGVLEPPPDGWHDTGDIVSVDRDGFVTIKGRAKRFAKIGGEMVSLAAVEALASELWPSALSAVAATPDPRKGERLVLVTDMPGADRAAFVAFARARGAADLMVPAEVAPVPKVPLLGSGKIDYAAVARLVREREAANAAAAASRQATA
ncbi:acyl-[ACP]--phospholipid O-acyltransferase [Alsobacter sp. SYSU M60028]|uniref:Acyl-[ACP]--phospholipid O-acyltransferase n=1 Tax=Alsobacter ponti TaxID=2962936 RepID=A0ABT1L7X9_9HYPH|nr:acyl-[ACP]--phospholipid O-acyltransferase [Alsobacter ponti]MCP8937537.1 acyl-[ACP]--phospholipid O-acyltransferase [Alsobacter ponti]